MATPELQPPRIAEARALDAARQAPGERALCTTLGRAQAARQLAHHRAEARVSCWFLDEFLQRLAAAVGDLPPNLTLQLNADAPEAAVDLAVIPLSIRGEAELARDVIQLACQRLTVGGTLVTSVDNPRDRWVREQLGAWFDRVQEVRHDDATSYIARKTSEPRKWKNFRAEFAFRDRGMLLRAISRPGVFSHRRVDPGARQLLAAAEPVAHDRVLEIGCGAGVVAIALAARDPSISVHAVDSHTRAVECTLAGAALNGLGNVSVELNSSGQYGREGEFDMAVANPPYYADFEIAARFLAAAEESLRPGGRLLLVTKQPDWYQDNMPKRWAEVVVAPSQSYYVVSAVKA